MGPIAASGQEDFAALLDASLGEGGSFEGAVVKGRVIRVTDEFAIVDVGLKSEGVVPLKEFSEHGQKPALREGDVAFFSFLDAGGATPRDAFPGVWDRLQAVRRAYDPEGVFGAHLAATLD